MSDLTLSELSRRAKLRSRRADLLIEILYLVHDPLASARLEQLQAEVEQITEELKAR